MGHKHHQIHLKNLRENEQVLHNCSSHSIIHLKVHLYYFLGLLLPLVGLIFFTRSEVTREAAITAWFLFTCYGMILSTYFFVRGVNFELGGCVITNQRVLRFGYMGLWQTVEREIAPNRIEDFKIVKQGLLSLFFNTANIYITTSNRQTDVLRYIIEPEKVHDAYATMMKSAMAHSVAQTGSQPDSGGAAWIDEALGHPRPASFNLEEHRRGVINSIANVFRGKKGS
jgi:hypothetical protein